MDRRTPYLYDAFLAVGLALLLVGRFLDVHTFGMVMCVMIGTRLGVSSGKRSALADVERGRIRIEPRSDRPPPPSDDGAGGTGGRSTMSSSEPPETPPTSAVLAIVGALRSSGAPGVAAATVAVLVLLALLGFADHAAVAGR